jgi:LDH2 family malate/lactate/ureidoglycolate dehydrogenase
MPLVTADQLTPLSEAIFRAAGASPANAARVTEAMVSANLAGHDSHGVQHIPGYVAEIERGAIDPTGQPAVLRETDTTALVSGGWTFGHVGAAYAARLAIEKARRQHLAAVSLVEVHHIGRLGEYGEMGVTAGIVVIAAAGFGHRHPNVAPYGGARALLATNPMTIGIPTGEQPGMVLDFATSIVAAGKVSLAHAKGEQLPPGMVIDREGRPTTEPRDLFEGGALLPFGGHKGFALALAIEFLGRILGGGEAHATGNRGGNYYGESGTLFLAIDPATFRPAADYAAAAADLVGRVKATPPAPGFDAVLIPGDPERQARAARLANGIPIPTSTWEAIGATARTYGVALPTL